MHRRPMHRHPRLVASPLPAGRAAAGVVLLTTLVLGGCQAGPSAALEAAQPHTAPVRTITNFDESLRCMDEMFLAQGKHDVFITTAGIPDATGLIAAGTKEMFISAVSRMSARSNAFRFVDYDPTQTDVQVLSELVGLRDDFVAPSYYVRGAITQLDSSVLSSSVGGSVSVPGLDLAASRDQVISVITVDLNVAKLTTRQILPGISANNSIAVVQTGGGADTGGLIGKVGLTFSISLNRSEGFAQAVRNLIDLSTIEVLGKLTRVPYWQCLSIPSTNPEYRTEAREWFDVMPEGEREHFVRDGLVRTGYLQSADADDLTGAIGRYQADRGLIANGRIDFDLYYNLLAGAAAKAATPARTTVTIADTPPAPTTPSAPAPAPAPEPAPPVSAPQAILSTDRGPRPSYRAGETMAVQVQPTQDAYIYCYYRDAEGSVARIFPNRFQPDPFVRARSLLEIPPGGRRTFDLRVDQPNTQEQVSCLAAATEIGLHLPDALKVKDLEPLPVHGLDDIAAGFRAVPGAKVAEARMTIEVTR